MGNGVWAMEEGLWGRGYGGGAWGRGYTEGKWRWVGSEDDAMVRGQGRYR